MHNADPNIFRKLSSLLPEKEPIQILSKTLFFFRNSINVLIDELFLGSIFKLISGQL